MIDNPLPTPPTNPSVAETSASPPGEGIQASRNSPGITMDPSHGSADNKPMSPSMLDWLKQNLLQFGLLVGIWVSAFAVLYLMGQNYREALGWATVVALIGSFFTRTLIPLPLEKTHAQTDAAPHQHVDSAREVLETVVFVVVLVLLLKSFVAEAFVIPTGSMAQTLWGYQKVVKCPQCGEEFPVNCSGEIDPPDGHEPRAVNRCTCPNCRLEINLLPKGMENPQPEVARNIPDPGFRSGDRVLVSKYAYDLFGREPDRLDVVVFKFPGEYSRERFPRSGPVKRHVPINYIKRLIGLPGETIGIHQGKLYVLAPMDPPLYNDLEKVSKNPDGKLLLWQFNFTHHDDPEGKARKAFEEGKFTIVRKNPENILAMRRLVYDYDHQAKDLTGPEHQRWVFNNQSGWSTASATGFKHDGSGMNDGYAWLRYRHVLRNSPGTPQLITDFMAYNAFREANGGHSAPGENWASDLIVECNVDVEQPLGNFGMEISRGIDRFQALFDLSTGACTLHRLRNGQKPEELKTVTTSMKKKGSYHVRFANVDDRLTVWVNGELPFGDGVPYERILDKDKVGKREIVPVKENDLERPVSVGSQGAQVTVSHLKVFRDTYYTTARNETPSESDVPEFNPIDPETWKHFKASPLSTYYVQPGHYLCLGDNSPESSDGRTWGLVPRRLLLGRAVLVYFPFSRAGRIR